jgi:hypothetical protein
MISKVNNHELQVIPLQTAYNQYINLIHPDDVIDNGGEYENDDAENSCDDDNDDGALRSTPMKALIADNTNNHNETTKLVNVIINDGKCVVCNNMILHQQKYELCYECGCKMHEVNECEFGMIRYTYKGKIYCSLKCHLQQENYEVRIVGENTINKTYTVMIR